MPNALTGFRIDVKDLLNQTARREIASAAISTVQSRIRNSQDITDSTATPYSQRGPIYIPVVNGLKHWNSNNPNRGYLRGVGHNKYLRTYGVSKRYTSFAKKNGTSGDGPSRTGNSLRFKNWEHFKKYLGHSGSRDLEVTGKMLRSILVTDNQPFSVSIGFIDDKEEAKMKGNQARSPQFGFSPNDIERIYKAFDEMLDRNAKSIFEQLLRQSAP